MASVDAAQREALRPAARARWPGLEPATLGFTAVLLVVAFLVVGPIVLLLLNSFEVGAVGTPTTWGLGNWQAALADPKIRAALWNTVTLAAARQGIAIVVGVLLAWLIARTDLPGRDWLEFGFWVAVFLPTLTVTLGWIMVFDSFNGLANQALERCHLVEKGPFDIFSWWGIVWVHLMTGTMPVKVMLLTPAFRNLDATLEEARRSAGASPWRTLWRVVVPLLAPTILVVLVLGTIRSLEAFEIELVLGCAGRDRRVQHADLSARARPVARVRPGHRPEHRGAGDDPAVRRLPAVVRRSAQPRHCDRSLPAPRAAAWAAGAGRSSPPCLPSSAS